MATTRPVRVVSALFLVVVAAGCGRPRGARGAHGSDGPSSPDPDPGPPADKGADCADKNPLKNVYFGDLHVHTAYSLDSYAVANRNEPREAYRFARGEPLQVAAGKAQPGPSTRLGRPLDFAAVTDHSEFLGVVGTCMVDPNSGAYDSPYCKKMRDQGTTLQKFATYAALFQLARDQAREPFACRFTEERRERCEEEERSLWQKTQEAAQSAYDRCHFTTFKAFEWSGQSGMANIHRNVIYSGDKVPPLPFDFIHYPSSMMLWQALSRECRSSEGCDAITIPHNSNASVGIMWDTADDPRALPFMRRYQTLVELFQHKGNSECLPDDPVGDRGCDFELIRGSAVKKMLGLEGKNADDTESRPGYIRNGMARGLSFEANRQQNPIQVGFVGSTDTHNATPGHTEEVAWPGHVGGKDATAETRLKQPDMNPGGLTGVWAEQNTRESIFAALKRRETFATSGTRLVVRFYEVSGLASDQEAKALCDDPMFPQKIVDKGGAPMGSLFAPQGKPYLFVFALKDQNPLASVDFIKMSAGGSGAASVAVKSVPIAEASSRQACVFWSDDAFDPSKPTLYYARVLEQPSWRWTHQDCAEAPGADPKGCQSGGPLDVKIQERAWTSPIFSKLVE